VNFVLGKLELESAVKKKNLSESTVVEIMTRSCEIPKYKH
jgi:hypothetical protein